MMIVKSKHMMVVVVVGDGGSWPRSWLFMVRIDGGRYWNWLWMVTLFMVIVVIVVVLLLLPAEAS